MEILFWFAVAVIVVSLSLFVVALIRLVKLDILARRQTREDMLSFIEDDKFVCGHLSVDQTRDVFRRMRKCRNLYRITYFGFLLTDFDVQCTYSSNGELNVTVYPLMNTKLWCSWNISDALFLDLLGDLSQAKTPRQERNTIVTYMGIRTFDCTDPDLQF